MPILVSFFPIPFMAFAIFQIPPSIEPSIIRRYIIFPISENWFTFAHYLCPAMKQRILFVCLGNICRSSSAEGVMKHLVEEAGRADEFLIDSAGILSYHQGELPDSRMRAHAARRGYNLTHLSRPVRTEDFYNFDLIIGMDDRNIDDLKDRAPSTAEWSKIHRMTEYCTKFTHADHVPDPYYGGSEGFEYVLDILEDACAGLLDSVSG